MEPASLRTSAEQEFDALRRCRETLERLWAERTRDGRDRNPSAEVFRDLAKGLRPCEERFRASEERFRASEERFRRITSNLTDMVCELDPEARFVFVNQAYEKILGYMPEDLLGRSAFDKLHPDDLESVRAIYMDSVRLLKVAGAEFRYRKADGSYVWIEALGTPIIDEKGRYNGSTIINRVITERKEAEDLRRIAFEDLERRVGERTAELSRANSLLQREVADRGRAEKEAHESEARYRALLSAVPDLLFRLRRDGTFLDYKPAKDIELYRPPEEFLGRKISEVLPPELNRQYQKYVQRAFETGQVQSHEYDLQIRGETRRFESRLVVLGKDEVISIIRDVSEQKLAEERERQHRDELARVARLAMMGEMASGLAHELNQPLTAIATYAGACSRLIRSGGGNHGDLLSALDHVVHQAERAGEVIRGLRSFLVGAEQHRSLVNVNDLVLETMRLDEGELRINGIQVQLDLCQPPATVTADRIQIQQVLLNLLRNAQEAMAGVKPGDRRLAIGTELKGRKVVISVSDVGCGVSPDIAGRLYEPFNTTKSGGMGMGLPISRRIIEAHQGQLWFEPNPVGPGATFFFSLPEAGESGSYGEAANGLSRG